MALSFAGRLTIVVKVAHTADMTTQPAPPEAIEQEMIRMKAYYPFRIVFCALVDGVWEVQARTTMAVPNRLARAGMPVYLWSKQ